MTKTLYW